MLIKMMTQEIAAELVYSRCVSRVRLFKEEILTICGDSMNASIELV